MDGDEVVLDLFDQGDDFLVVLVADVLDGLEGGEEGFAEGLFLFVPFQVLDKAFDGMDEAGDFLAREHITDRDGAAVRLGIEKVREGEADELADGFFQLTRRFAVGAGLFHRVEGFHDLAGRRFRGIGRFRFGVAGRGGVQEGEVGLLLRGEGAGVVAVRQAVHHGAEVVDALQEEIDEGRRGGPFPGADFTQDVFHDVREILDVRQVEKAGIALDRMDRAEDAVDDGQVVRIGFEGDKQRIEPVQDLLAFGNKVLQQCRIDAAHIRRCIIRHVLCSMTTQFMTRRLYRPKH